MKHFTHRSNPDDIHTVLKIAWLTGETSIQRLDAFAIQHPDMVVKYAYNNDLAQSTPFRWTTLYRNWTEPTPCSYPDRIQLKNGLS